MNISSVGVLGGGTMGSGIAEVCARSGVTTTILELSPEFAEAAQRRIESSLEKAASRDRITPEQHATARDGLRYTSEIGDLSGCDLTIEAVIENEAEKVRLFGLLDEVLPEHAILASNTSSIPIIVLAGATTRPGQVIGMHFFNPATVQPLCELVVAESTSSETHAAVEGFAQQALGKTTITAKDRAGFVVNRLLVPYLLAAITMLDSGLTTKEDIDAGMRGGCAHPMGPLELCDLIGLDTIEMVADVMYQEFKEPLYAPPPLLRRLVSAGRLGRKSGEGFYTY